MVCCWGSDGVRTLADLSIDEVVAELWGVGVLDSVSTTGRESTSEESEDCCEGLDVGMLATSSLV